MRKLLIMLLVLSATAMYGSSNESLLIGAGDEVHIQVFDTPELEQHSRVTDRGTVDLILGGPVEIGGLTPDAAARAIEQVLVDKKFMNAPHVIVTVEQYATEKVSVLGQVKAPGSYPIATPRSIIDVLSMAGGLTDLADRRITIERHEGKNVIDYFLSNDPQAAFKDAVLIYPGDKVIIPRAKMIYVLGDVGRPGGYPWSTNDSQLTVLQAVSLAGGTPPTAKTSHARLIRRTADGYIEIPLPLADIQKGKRADMRLLGDDIIYVPFSYMKNAAIGLGGIIAAASSAAIYVH